MKLQEAVELQKEALLKNTAGKHPNTQCGRYTGGDAPYGMGIRDCLDHALQTAKELGFSVVNLDNRWAGAIW